MPRPPAAGPPPSARPRCRPTRSTRSPRSRAPRSPPRECCTARRTRCCWASSPSATSRGALGCARAWARTGRCSSEPARARTSSPRPRTTSRRLRGWRERTRRLAGSAGYVATELAKEAPYYAGAFGAALVSDSVSSGDALVFLAGANLGAAAYEYGLARLTRAFLRRGHASFDADWVPGEYLEDYYAVVEPDEIETIAFFADAIRETRPQAPILFFGTGPTLHHVFLSADRASEIHLADYLPQNLAEIDRWLRRDAGAHDWRPFVRYTLQCEGLDAPTEAQLAEREELTRAKVTRLLQADAGDREPLGERYDTVVSAYCADSATADRATWESYMRHIAGLVEPGGVFITAALRRSRSYLVGGKQFPSAHVDEHDLRAVLEPEFDCAIEVREVPEHARLGYAGIVLATARRRRPASAPAPA